MKTSLSDIKKTEQYLLGDLAPGDALVFEAQQLTNRDLRLNVHAQNRLMTLLKYYFRKQLKRRAGEAGARMMTDPDKQAFREKISRIFNQ